MPRLVTRAIPSRALTSHPARAGFRPAAAALAVATAFTWPLVLRAQPVGGQAVAGQATFVRNGANLLVTTQNAAGTNHSAINWQSFSVPVGSVTQFNQPSATSTSINRVLGPDPSSIFGTLSSNGRLVLVNPAGIAVGTGAVVDTAGFTASTLPMSEADAIAGRLRFAGNGGALQVDGSIVARSGDVVLIAPAVQTGSEAVVQANGATVLAAGQKVEITGRGLEGIRLEVQAPENQAVNLGTLKGDAVGIFAGTLKHSGLVQAQAITAEGGKVLLKAQGDNLVDGTVQGRNIDVLGERVGLLAGAAIDASGAQGGGQVRIGGDYQGKNADVANAKRTYVDAQATIKADATVQGDGGTVIVWSDEATRMNGQISARGGAQGGDGGFVEVSGKDYLQFAGRADTRAPQGRNGLLLLDPNDIVIDNAGPTDTASTGANFSGGTGTSHILDADLNAQLGLGSVLVTTSAGTGGVLGGQITVDTTANVNWSTASTLTLHADNGIVVNGTVNGYAGAVRLETVAGDIQKAASAYLSAGKVEMTTPGNVLVEGSLYGNNGIDIQAGTNVTIGSTGSAYLNVGSGSTTGVRIGAGGNVDFGTFGGTVYAYHAPIDITAGGSILGSANLSTQGTINGSVHLTATNGSISTGGINSSGSYSGIPGGEVRLIGKGNVSTGTINAYGGYGYGSSGSAGGSVYVESQTGSVNVGSVNTYGGSTGSSSLAVAAGGAGGNVTLKGIGAVVASSIATNGGDGNNAAGGAGGTVVVDSQAGTVTVGNVASYGGSNTFSSVGVGAGGMGGNVTLHAGAGAVVAGSIAANGGYGYGADGGAGGTVIVDAAAGSITAAGISSYGGDGTYSSLGVGAGGAGGNVTLNAGAGTLAAGSISAQGGQASGGNGGSGGTVLAKAQGGSLALGGINSYGGDGGGSPVGLGGTAGNVTLLATSAGSTLNAGDISAYSGSSSGGSGAAGGAIAVNAAGNIQLGYLEAGGGGGSGSGFSGGAGGTITITSANGGIASGLTGGSSIAVYGGASVQGGYGNNSAAAGSGGMITMSAAGPVTVIGSNLNADGGGNGTSGGNGGTISVVAAGDVQLQGASAEGAWVSFGSGNGGAGGQIQVTSNGGSVSGGYLYASGGAALGSSGSGGRGGTITVLASQNLSVGGVSANGGFASMGSSGGGMGGAGGAVQLTATNGGFSATSSLEASGGGSYGGNGANGGSIAVRARGNVSGRYLYAEGGETESTVAGATGGAGGTISVTSDTGSIALGQRSGSSISVYGGAMVRGGQGYSMAAGGAGGAVTLSAAQGDILATDSLNAEGGQAGMGATGGKGGVITVQGNGPVVLNYVTARGGSPSMGSGNGGAGGKVILTSTAGDLDLYNLIDASGASAASGGTGGAGGEAVIKFAGNLVRGLQVYANGGSGGDGTVASPNGGTGGAGGRIDVEKTAGDWSLDGVWLNASGGNGGYAEMEVSTTGVGGAGGNGGTVQATASGGSFSSSGGGLWATAGAGGYASDDSTQAANGSVLGMVSVKSQGGMDLSGIDLDVGYASFNAQAGGDIVLSSAIYSIGGSVNLHAGDPSIPGANPAATTVVNADIDTTGGFSTPGGAITLAGSYGVLIDVQAPTLNLLAVAAPTANVQGGPITLTGPNVAIAAGTSVAGDSVAIQADSVQIDGTASAGVTGLMKIDALSAGRTVRLGGTDELGSLNLAQSEFDNIQAGTLVIGNTANTGSVVVETPVSFNRDAIGALQVLTGGGLQLNGSITANAAVANTVGADAVVLAANAISVGAGGGINVTDGRWLTYISGPLGGNNFGTLASGQRALWNRTFAGSPPGTVTEAGNRYLFAFQPTITIDATNASKVYDGTAITSGAFTATPVIDASAYGSVWLQDPNPTISVKVANLSKNVGSYAIVQDSVTVPDGYAVVFHEGVAKITPRTLALTTAAQSKVYDATTAATAAVNADNRVAGDDLSVTVGSASFSDKNVGAGKTVTAAGLGLSGADAGNYVLASGSTTTTANITPASVTVAANNLAKVQGTDLAFTGTEFTATGLVGGETIASVSLASPGQPADAPVGAYAITASSAVGANGFLAGNYNVSYINGALAVISPAQNPEVTGPVATFATLFIEQLNQQNALDRKKTDIGKDDIVLTDTQCRN